MPNVYYKQTHMTSSDIEAIKKFGRFLDDSHHEITYNLHEELVDFHSVIDDEVQEKLNEYKELIDELKSRIEELESEE